MYMTSDAGLRGIGAWIGQINSQGELMPVICASKKLTKTQQRWPATKRELYALMWAMNKFRNYLLGRHFVARVDHKPLVALLRNRATLLTEGWMDTILKFNFTTEYLPGDKNILADALSRCYDDEESINVNAAKIDGTHLNNTSNRNVIDPSSDSGELESNSGSKSVNILQNDEEIENTSANEQALIWEAELRGLKFVPKEDRKALMEMTHIQGHFGSKSMQDKLISEGYWWPRMRIELQDEVARCHQCQIFNVERQGFHPAKSIVAREPWDHIQVDLIGPLPTADSGAIYILNIVDVCTGYSVLRSIENKEMETVARVLWKVFADYGTPKIMQSDNGTEFVNKIVSTLCQLYGIEHRLITAYNAHADGLVERKNKDVEQVLRKYLEGAFGAWDDWLPMVQIAVNDAINQRTKSTPFALMYGRKFNGFRDFSNVKKIKDSDRAFESVLKSWIQFREAILPGIFKRTMAVKSKQEGRLNERKQKNVFKPGDKVMAINHTRGSKWEPYYEGPFEVIRQNTGGAYALKNVMGNEIPWNYTIEMLKGVPGVKNESEDKKSDHFEVEKIMDHQSEGASGWKYLVKWKGYSENENTWVSAKDFDSLGPIEKYWRERAKNKKNKPLAASNVDLRSGREGCESVKPTTRRGLKQKS
jgi:hypothetical protein